MKKPPPADASEGKWSGDRKDIDRLVLGEERCVVVQPAPGVVLGGEARAEGDEFTGGGDGNREVADLGGGGHRSQAARMHCC